MNINIEIEITKRDQIEILKWKSTINEMVNSLEPRQYILAGRILSGNLNID